MAACSRDVPSPALRIALITHGSAFRPPPVPGGFAASNFWVSLIPVGTCPRVLFRNSLWPRPAPFSGAFAGFFAFMLLTPHYLPRLSFGDSFCRACCARSGGLTVQPAFILLASPLCADRDVKFSP